MDAQTILTFLEEVDADFTPALSQKVNLAEYATKLHTLAHLEYEMEGDQIVGLVAGYTNNRCDTTIYIPLVAVIKEYRCHGVASRLLERFIQYVNFLGGGRIHITLF